MSATRGLPLLGVLASLFCAVARCQDPGAPAARAEAGSVIVFCSDRSGRLQLYRRDPEGRVEQLGRSDREERRPRCSPDGKQLVYESRGRDGSDLFVLQLDGSAPPRRLTREGGASAPDWSPDGSWIAFESTRDGDRALYLLDLEDGTEHRLSPAGADDRDPSWSPDGRWVAFSRRQGPLASIFLVRADGSELRELGAGGGLRSRPRWCLDGRTLVCQAAEPGRGAELILLDLEGTARALTDRASLRQEFMDRNLSNWAPTVDPSDRCVVFCSLRAGTADLYSLDPTSGRTVRLTEHDGHELDPELIPLGPVRADREG